jgi:uncharacterized protein
MNGHLRKPLNFDEIMDTGLADRELLKVNCDKLYDEMCTIVAEYAKWVAGEEHDPYFRHFAEIYVRRVRGAVRGRTSLRLPYARCGNGFSVLNLDLSGNLYKCHNMDQVVGTIRDGFWRVLGQSIAADPTWAYGSVCEECPVVSLCGCGCPLIGPSERRDSYCRVKLAMYLPVIEFITGRELPRDVPWAAPEVW